MKADETPKPEEPMSTLTRADVRPKFSSPKTSTLRFFWADLQAMKVDFQQIRDCTNIYEKFHQFKTIVLVGDQSQRISSNEFKSYKNIWTTIYNIKRRCFLARRICLNHLVIYRLKIYG